jgi:hypothetical protein
VENCVLNDITKHFKAPDTLHKLSPAYEPTAEPKSKLKEAKFAELQKLTKARLVEPVHPHEHMYFAAMENGACRLTNLGHFYWLLSNAGRFKNQSKKGN